MKEKIFIWLTEEVIGTKALVIEERFFRKPIINKYVCKTAKLSTFGYHFNPNDFEPDGKGTYLPDINLAYRIWIAVRQEMEFTLENE